MATVIEQEQFNSLWTTTENNTLLPFSSIKFVNKQYRTINKQTINAINELLDSIAGDKLVLDKTVISFNGMIAAIGDSKIDGTLLTKLHAIGDNVILAIDNINTKIEAVKNIQGTPGVDGANGIQGIQGVQGLPGANGIQGLQGTPGIDGGGTETVKKLIRVESVTDQDSFIKIPIPAGTYVDDENINVYCLKNLKTIRRLTTFTTDMFSDEQKLLFKVSQNGTRFDVDITKITEPYVLYGSKDIIMDFRGKSCGMNVDTNRQQAIGSSKTYPIFSIDGGITWQYIKTDYKAYLFDPLQFATIKPLMCETAYVSYIIQVIGPYLSNGTPIRFGFVFDFIATSYIQPFQYSIDVYNNDYVYIPRTENGGTTLITNYTVVKENENIFIILPEDRMYNNYAVEIQI